MPQFAMALNPALMIRLIAAACLMALASQPAAALDQVSLQLKWKHQFQFAGYYAALERGFYRDAIARIFSGMPDELSIKYSRCPN